MIYREMMSGGSMLRSKKTGKSEWRSSSSAGSLTIIHSFYGEGK